MKKVEIPQRLYYKIGEVARIVGVKPYVLRYWESEIPALRPSKTKSRHRLYRRKDVEMLLEIKRLLYAERYTMEGAKKRLRELQRHSPRRGSLAASEEKPLNGRAKRALVAKIQRELIEIVKLLDRARPETRVAQAPAGARRS